MALRSRSGSFRGRTPKRITAWEQGPGSTLKTTISAATPSAVLGFGIQPLVEGLTIVRLRGAMQCFMNLENVMTVGEGFHCALGIGVVTNEAFAVGLAALPTPLDDAGFDMWMYHRFFDLHIAEATGVGVQVGTAGLSSIQFEVDTKAMRKITVGETLYMVIESAAISGTPSADTYFDSRVLFKLP